MYNKIKRLSEQDQLSIMRRGVKFKKLLFSDLPSDFKLFRHPSPIPPKRKTKKPILETLKSSLSMHRTTQKNNWQNICKAEFWKNHDFQGGGCFTTWYFKTIPMQGNISYMNCPNIEKYEYTCVPWIENLIWGNMGPTVRL